MLSIQEEPSPSHEHRSQWMKNTFGMCMASETEVMLIGFDFVVDRFSDSTKDKIANDDNLMLSEFQSDQMDSFIAALIQGRTEFGRTQTFIDAMDYVRCYSSLSQLLRIRSILNAPKWREAWGGNDCRDSVLSIEKFGTAVDESIYQELIDTLLCSTGEVDVQSDNPFSACEKRVMGRQAIMLFGLISIYQQTDLSNNNRASCFDGGPVNERTVLPANSTWYISRGLVDDPDTTGFYFEYPELKVFLNRPANTPVFCIAPIEHPATAPVPWHIFVTGTDVQTSSEILIGRSSDSKSPVASQQAPVGTLAAWTINGDVSSNHEVCQKSPINFCV